VFIQINCFLIELTFHFHIENTIIYVTDIKFDRRMESKDSKTFAQTHNIAY
jgi:hypothetical protein